MYALLHRALVGLLGLFLLLPGHAFAQQLSGRLTPAVAILQPSRIYVAGKSNVNRFSCDCEQDFSVARPSFHWEASPPTLVFQNTRLRLRTEKLDCGNRAMNRDLQNTLQADQHPTISLNLRRLRFSGGDRNNVIGPEWTDLTAQTLLTLAGETQPANIRFRVRSVGHEVYELVGVHEVRMTDFGIDPPTALLGMVKVEDRMQIHFKLWLSVRQEEEDNPE